MDVPVETPVATIKLPSNVPFEYMHVHIHVIMFVQCTLNSSVHEIHAHVHVVDNAFKLEVHVHEHTLICIHTHRTTLRHSTAYEGHPWDRRQITRSLMAVRDIVFRTKNNPVYTYMTMPH